MCLIVIGEYGNAIWGSKSVKAVTRESSWRDWPRFESALCNVNDTCDLLWNIFGWTNGSDNDYGIAEEKAIKEKAKVPHT
jgi:hypothetical protein